MEIGNSSLPVAGVGSRSPRLPYAEGPGWMEDHVSFFRYMFDSDLVQRHDIERLKSSKHATEKRNRRRMKEADSRIEYLEDEVEELDLLTSALMQILMDKHGLTPEELTLAIGKVRQQEADAARKQQKADEAREAADKRDRPKAPTPTKRRRS